MSKNEKIYEVITKKVVEQLENAIKTGESFSWIKSWNGEFIGNAYTGYRYRGINLLLLDSRYITFNQLQEFQKKHPEKNFKIKKGCHKHTVYFYKFSELKQEDIDMGEIVFTKIPLIRFYSVFDINDIENLPEYFKLEEYQHEITDVMENADKVINDYCERDGLKFETVAGSDRCFYRPSEHKISLPPKSQFKDANEYYSALFHELGHSTSKTLERDMKGYFGSKDYSFEELVAELTSQMVMSSLGFDCSGTFSNSVAYLQNWLSQLNSDVSMIVRASNKAQKAADLILNKVYEAVEEEQKTA